MTPPRPTHVACALGAAALTWTLHQGAVGLAPEVGAAKWRTLETAVPLVGSTVPGELRPLGTALDLQVGSGVSPITPELSTFKISFDAVVPEGGQLMLRWGDTLARLMPQHPTGAGYSEGREFVDLDAMAGALLVVDRSPRKLLSLRGVGGCQPIPAPGERFHLDLALNERDFTLAIDGAPALRCTRTAAAPVGDIVLSSGVRRVQIDDFAMASGGFKMGDRFGGPWRHWGVGLALAALAGAYAAGRSSRGLAFALLPALVGPWLTARGTRATLDGWRLVGMPEAAGPLLFAALPAVLLAMIALSARLRLRATLGLGLACGLAVPVFAGLGGADPVQWLMLGSIVPIWALIAWVNTHPVRARPAISLALSAAAFGLAEGGVRWADQHGRWTVTSGWRRATEEFQELIEIQRYRSYPDKGFPIQPPEPDPAHRRIVAFGGSSTGGAFNFDNLEMFWPARLGALLGDTDWRVVNQGVGGWNTLHIRLYLESQIERLDPDIVVLYVGHNDLGEAPMPYRVLYNNWSARRAPAASEALSRLRLYNGLRFGLLALTRQGGSVAVPLGDAEDNLSAIARIAADHGAKVLFLTEGLNPDPHPMLGYAAVQARVAEAHGGRAANAAQALYESGRTDLFLDDCHLTVAGHNLVARFAREQLEGWL